MTDPANFCLEMRNLSRSISDVDWASESALHIRYWKDAQTLLGKQTVNHDGFIYEIDIDLSSGIERLEYHYKVMESLYDERCSYKLEFSLEPVSIPISVFVVEEGESSRNLAEEVLKSVLFDFFLIMNLAAPGSFDMYSASLKGRSRFEYDFRLSNVVFDSARVSGLEGKPLTPECLPLQDVMEWYRTVRSGLRQIPQNPTEKCLFAILHLATSDVGAPTSAWVFYALEALLQTSPGQNLAAVRERASLILEIGSDEDAYLKKGLRSVYDVRSSFVHGGMAVGHPLQNELIDRGVDDYVMRQIDASDFGCALIITFIQKMIVSRITCPRFQQVLLK